MPRSRARGLTAVLSHAEKHRFKLKSKCDRRSVVQTGGRDMSSLRGKPLGYSVQVISETKMNASIDVASLCSNGTRCMVVCIIHC
jgi:hypothetical protein